MTTVTRGNAPNEVTAAYSTSGKEGGAATKAREARGVARYRTIAIAVGALFIAGDIAGVLSYAFTSGLFDEPGYLARIEAHQNRLMIGSLCVLAMGFFLAGVSFLMYPIFRKHNEAFAMGYVVFRGALETVVYMAQATTWWLLAALSRDYVKEGASGTQFNTLGRVLNSQRSVTTDMTEIVFSVGALMFAYLFYQSRLIPRWLSIWGFIGALGYLAVPLLNLFRVSAGFLMAPLALQEIVLAVRLIAKGFDSTRSDALPIASGRPVGRVK
jgi:Domain of unknown function (DUF4386)